MNDGLMIHQSLSMEKIENWINRLDYVTPFIGTLHDNGEKNADLRYLIWFMPFIYFGNEEYIPVMKKKPCIGS
jgi:hypothetical protein